MVKLICDRCKKDIEEKYYVINFWEYETNPKYEPITSYATSCTYSTESRDSALKFLNSRTMYCKKCKNEIEKFINKE